jgi:hypothetical protein
MASVRFTFRHIRTLKYVLATTSFISQRSLAPDEQIIKFYRANFEAAAV